MLDFVSKNLRKRFWAILIVIVFIMGLNLLFLLPVQLMIGNFSDLSTISKTLIYSATKNYEKIIHQNGTPLTPLEKLMLSLTPEQWRTLIIVIISNILVMMIVGAFYQGGFISMLTQERCDFKSNISTFFKKGLALTPKILLINILITLILVGIIIVGWLIGVVVYPIASLFAILALIFAIYALVKLEFAQFEASIANEPATYSISSSWRLTNGYMGSMFLAILTISVISNLIGSFFINIYGLNQFFSTVSGVLILMFIAPLYLRAKENVR